MQKAQKFPTVAVFYLIKSCSLLLAVLLLDAYISKIVTLTHKLRSLQPSLIHAELTRTIIGSAMAVHKILGPGLLESAYEECLSFELNKSGLFIERQKGVPVIYKDIRLEVGYRIDILVENTVVLKLKTVDEFKDVHEAQILTYMKFSMKPIGLLINFNVPMLKQGIKRFVM